MNEASLTNLEEIHRGLSSSEFEKLVSVLLDKMGFTDVQLTGRPGDGGIDLKATWAPQVPALRIELDFIVQAKRFKPEASLPPRFVRELRGKLKSGQWGLLISTSRVSSQTRQEGLEDSSRTVFVIDGRQLVDLCQEYEVGFKTEYRFDRSFLRPLNVEETSPPPELTSGAPSNLESLLSKSLGRKFERLGKSPIYKGLDMTLLARWSQKYPRHDLNYWFGLTPRDLSSVEEYGVTGFAYVCGDDGVVIIPAKEMLLRTTSGKLGRSPREGDLRHYHIQFGQKGDKFEWIMKDGARGDVSKYFHRFP